MTLYRLSPLVLQTLIWIPTRLVLKWFLHFKVRGLFNLTELPRGVIFAVNHTSELDSILVPAALPFLSRFSPMFYTSREKSFYSRSGWRQRFYGGNFFKLWGAYPVGVGLKDYGKELLTHTKILRDGGSLCIFPEGRRSDNGRPMEPKGGVGYLALKTGAPVVPVGISGAFLLTLADFFGRRRRVILRFGRPMRKAEFLRELGLTTLPANAEEPSPEDCKKIARLVMRKITELLSG